MSTESPQLATSSRLRTTSIQVKTVAIDTSVPTTLAEPRSRCLRARPSLPDPFTGTPLLTPHANGLGAQAKGMEAISHGLRDEAIIGRREKRITEKEKQLKEVIESHDGLIREKFHLERFVTLLEGWNPKVRLSAGYPGDSLRYSKRNWIIRLFS